MRKHYTKVLLIIMSTILLSGCSKPDIPFLNKSNETTESNSESGLTPEQEALIGTYTESGELIVGFDPSGMMITETPERSTSAQIGIAPEDLLSQMTTYDNLVITLYDDDDFNTMPIYIISYNIDSVSKTGKKLWYSPNNKGITYYNADLRKGWTNDNFTGWYEDNNSKIENLLVYFDPAKMKDIELTADDSYAYITGMISRAGIDKTPLMSAVAKFYPNTEDMNLIAMYDRKDNMVTYVRLICNTPNGSHRIDLSSVRTESKTITIPEYITEEKKPEIDVMMGIKNIPADAYIYSALYGQDSQFDEEGNRILTADKLVDIYSFNRQALQKKYEGIDVNEFITYFTELDLDMSVSEVLEIYYAGIDEGFTDINQQAAFTSMYDRLRALDSQLLEPNEDYSRKPPEKKRAIELTLEQDALIGTEAEDGSGTIEWFYEDGTPVIKPYEEGEKPEEQQDSGTTTMFTTTSVNKRSGPGTQYDKMGTVDPGTPVKVVGTSEEDPEWSECIDDEGNTFYMKTQYLK